MELVISKAVIVNASLKTRTRQARQERARCKAELLAALHEIKITYQLATNYEKRARAKAMKAHKLAIKAAQAAQEALTAERAAEQARDTAAEAKCRADVKRRMIELASLKLREVEQEAKQSGKQVAIKQNPPATDV